MTSNQPPKKRGTKSVSNKEAQLKARLQAEVKEFADRSPSVDEAGGLSTQHKYWRQELLNEISDSGQPTAPTQEPSSPADDGGVSTELKIRLHRKYMKKKLWLLMPILLILFYAGFHILRLDKYYSGLAHYLPWPVAFVNGDLVWVSELRRETELVKKFNVTNQPEQLAFNHIVEERLIRSKFQQFNLALPPSLLNSQVDNLKQEFGSDEAFDNFLTVTYNLTIQDFNRFILEPYLRRMLLQQYLGQDPEKSTEAENTILVIKQKIEVGELDFATAAQQYSHDDLSSSQGGNLGWFTWSTMLPAFEVVLRHLEIGEISQPVRSLEGYHLIKLDEADGQRPAADTIATTELGHIRISHIFIRAFDFNNWLESEKKQIRRILFLPMKI